MAHKRKEVAVIGAGTSGLMAIKCLKEENFEPFCFEKSSYVGGLWKFHEEDTKGVPSIMWSTSLNNSKEIGAISDFPPKPEYPNYMRHFDVLSMFTEYGNKFDLFRHITYNQEVISVRKADDYNKTGRWKVVVKNIKTDELQEHIFDAVMVCVGHLSLPNIPNYPGMDNFKGDIIHTHSIKKFYEFDNKNVCVVGTGSSALDAAVEISHVANQVYQSVRTPVWIITRHGPYGYPLDRPILTWEHNLYHKIFPKSWVDTFIQEVFLNPRFSHSLFNINPVNSVSDRDPAVNDTISSRYMNGTVIRKKDIKQFTENGVIFEEEEKETVVDAVVLGTGYKWDFPFLDSSDFVKEGSKVNLYKCVYPPHLSFPTLGIIGFLVPMGPGFPCVEMQCRWFVHNLVGKGHLPNQNVMKRHINNQYKENIKRYGDNSRVSVHVDFMPYLEDLASEIEASPSMLQLLFKDFGLFISCAFGPFVPYRFRLTGPHQWKDARNAILETAQRMKAPLQGKKAFEQKKNSPLNLYFISTGIILSFYLYRNKMVIVNQDNILILHRIYLVIKAFILNFLKSGSFSKFNL